MLSEGTELSGAEDLFKKGLATRLVSGIFSVVAETVGDDAPAGAIGLGAGFAPGNLFFSCFCAKEVDSLREEINRSR